VEEKRSNARSRQCMRANGGGSLTVERAGSERGGRRRGAARELTQKRDAARYSYTLQQCAHRAGGWGGCARPFDQWPPRRAPPPLLHKRHSRVQLRGIPSSRWLVATKARRERATEESAETGGQQARPREPHATRTGGTNADTHACLQLDHRVWREKRRQPPILCSLSRSSCSPRMTSASPASSPCQQQPAVHHSQ